MVVKRMNSCVPFILAMAIVVVLGSLCRLAYAAGATKRLGGADRYETMAAIVAEGFQRSDVAVVVTGETYPDALAASSLSGVLKCPIVTTKTNALTASSKATLERLGVKEVYIVGSFDAVGTEVESELVSMGIKITRISGATRYDTSVGVMQATRNAGSISDTVVVTTGLNFADALSIGSWTYQTATPIALVDKKGLFDEGWVHAITSDSAVKRILIVGGDAVVSEGIKEQLGSNYEYERLAGADRYATSVAIAQWSVAHGLTWQKPLIAFGLNFPDALAGAPLGGFFGSPVLLAAKPSDAATVCVAQNYTTIDTCYILGGESAVSKDAENSLATALATGQVPQYIPRNAGPFKARYSLREPYGNDSVRIPATLSAFVDQYGTDAVEQGVLPGTDLKVAYDHHMDDPPFFQITGRLCDLVEGISPDELIEVDTFISNFESYQGAFDATVGYMSQMKPCGRNLVYTTGIQKDKGVVGGAIVCFTDQSGVNTGRGLYLKIESGQYINGSSEASLSVYIM